MINGTPPSTSFRSRLLRSLAVLALVAAVSLPPIAVPSLQRMYAPVYDLVVLWAVGNIWYRFYPVSAVVLIPGTVLLAGLWIAWLFQIRFINRLQWRIATATIMRFPDHGPYHALKRLHLLLIVMVGRLPAFYRSVFPINRIPRVYDKDRISAYYLTVADSLCGRWADAYGLETTEHRAAQLRRRIIRTHTGLAKLYVPDIRSERVIDDRNLVMAISHLDEARIYGLQDWSMIRDLFMRYAERYPPPETGRAILSIKHMQHLLDQQGGMEKSVLLRILINLWFETGRPEVASVIIGVVSRHIDRTHHLFTLLLEMYHQRASVTPLNVLVDETLAFAALHHRYTHFIESARGRTYTIQYHQALDRLNRQAKQIVHVLQAEPRFLRASNIDQDTIEHIRRLAEEYGHLIKARDHYQQARAWRDTRMRLRKMRDFATRAMWREIYRTGHSQMLGRMDE